MNPKQAAAEEAAKREAELRASFVVVPPGDEAKVISCPICKEVLKSEFLEDEEDWVWKNAVKKDEKVCAIRVVSPFRAGANNVSQVYHATCHAEATSNTLAVRLRNEAGKRSRSSTPQTDTRGSPPKPLTGSGLRSELRPSASPSRDTAVAGTKRKVDSENTGVKTDGRDSPAAKKVAIAATA